MGAQGYVVAWLRLWCSIVTQTAMAPGGRGDAALGMKCYRAANNNDGAKHQKGTVTHKHCGG